MNWNNYRCPFCGGETGMGIMSLIARCHDCGAENTEMKDGKPTKWIMPCKEGSD